MFSFLVLLVLLQVKHFVFDFYYQPPYMWQNKGTFGHWGGITHSMLHTLATGIIIYWFVDSMNLILALMAFEFVAHYLIDFAKMNINRIKGWTATTHNEFWQLTGLDQLFHQLTYVAIIGAILNSYM